MLKHIQETLEFVEKNKGGLINARIDHVRHFHQKYDTVNIELEFIIPRNGMEDAEGTTRRLRQLPLEGQAASRNNRAIGQ